MGVSERQLISGVVMREFGSTCKLSSPLLSIILTFTMWVTL